MTTTIADLRYCPECGGDWRDSQIPVESVAAGYYGHTGDCSTKRSWEMTDDEAPIPCTCGPRFYSRVIGIELPYDSPNHYDGVSYWRQ